MDAGRREHRHSSPKNGDFVRGLLRGGSSGGVVSAGSKAKDGAHYGDSGTTHRRRELPASSGDSSFAFFPKGGGAFPFDPTSPFAAGAGGVVLLAGILATAVSFTFLYSRRSRRRSRRLAANYDSLLPLLLRDASDADGHAHPALLVGTSGAMATKWQYELVKVQPGSALVECHRSHVRENKVTTREDELTTPPADDAKPQPLTAASASASEAAKDSSLGTNEDSLIDALQKEEVLVVNTAATTAAKRLKPDEPRSIEIEGMVVCRVDSSSKRKEVLGGVLTSSSSTSEIVATADKGTGRCSLQRECGAESISNEAQAEHRTDSFFSHGLEVDGSMDSAALEENGNSDSEGLPSATPLEALGAHNGDRILMSRCDGDDLDQQDAMKTSTFILDKPAHSLELDMQTNGETTSKILLGVAKCCNGHDQVDATLDTRDESHPLEVSPCVTGDASTKEAVRAFLAPCLAPKSGKNVCLEEDIQKIQQTCASLLPTDNLGDNACKGKEATEKGRAGIAASSPVVDTVDETKTVSADRAEHPCTWQKRNVGEHPVGKPGPSGLGQSMSSRTVDGADSESHEHPRGQRAFTYLIVLLCIVALVLMLSVSGQVPVLQECFGACRQTYCRTDDFNAFYFLKSYGTSIQFTDEM